MRESLTFEITKKDIGYMMATRAFHLLGDISSDESDLCYITGESEGYYVGSWVTGFGFVNVLFPKRTTRPLTDEEVAYWSTQRVSIGSQPSYGFMADELRTSRKVEVA